MKIDSNTITIIVVTLVVAAGAYWYFFVGTGNQPPLTEMTVTENQADTQFQLLAGKLQPISFNTAIFSDARFTALVTLSTPVTPESPGRTDPFATISGVIGK